MNIHGCELFPEPHEVFADRIEEHRSVLLPFMIMPLSLIIPGSRLRIPWVIPHEPFDGLMGQDTHKYHTFFSRENWVSFHHINGKLSLDTDFSFFEKYQIEKMPLNERTIKRHGSDEFLLEEYLKVEGEYANLKIEFSNSPIALMDSHYVQGHRILGREKFPGKGIFEQLGGEVARSNWASTQGKPYFDSDSEYPKPIDEEGRPLVYLGTVRPRITQADLVLGFITEDLKRVCFTFDFF